MDVRLSGEAGLAEDVRIAPHTRPTAYGRAFRGIWFPFVQLPEIPIPLIGVLGPISEDHPATLAV